MMLPHMRPEFQKEFENSQEPFTTVQDERNKILGKVHPNYEDNEENFPLPRKVDVPRDKK